MNFLTVNAKRAGEVMVVNKMTVLVPLTAEETMENVRIIQRPHPVCKCEFESQHHLAIPQI